MPDRLELMRLSLAQREQRTLFGDGQPLNESREAYLRRVFGERHDFTHYTSTFHYVPSASAVQQGHAIIGQIGRAYQSAENLPPDEDFEAVLHVGWKAAVVLIDPRHHADGQKVAMNHDRRVGSPYSLLSSLVKHINASAPDAPFDIAIERIFDAASFWAFAQEHEGDITSLTFDFVTPNMFDGKESLEEELRDIRDSEKAQAVTVQLKSKNGLRTSTKRVKASVEYAERGAGKVKARTRTGARYNSKDKAKAIDLEPPTDTEERLLTRVVRQIGRFFSP